MKVIVDGLVTEYLRTGRADAPVVLLLPGWMSRAQNFAQLIEKLQRDYDVVTLNFPGFGVTENPPRSWSVQDYTDFTEKFIGKIGVKKIYAIVGHSFGGRVMLKGCASGQLHAAKLIFMGAAGVKPHVSMRSKIVKTSVKLSRVLPAGWRAKLSDKFSSDDYKNLRNNPVMRDTFKKVVDEDLTPLMPEVKSPSLLIWGRDDDQTPIAMAEVFAKNLPNADLKIIDNAGHYAFLDRPEEVARLVKEYLK